MPGTRAEKHCNKAKGNKIIKIIVIFLILIQVLACCGLNITQGV